MNETVMTSEIEMYDTTLRDGTQGEGVTFSVADKLRIAERLDAFGVHYIEGGWPGSNPKDVEFFAHAKQKVFRCARLAAFGSTRRKDTRVEDDDQVRLLLDADTPVVTIFGKTWLLHVLEVLQTTPEENLAMIADTVRFLKEHGKFVVYDAEHAFDGCKDDREYALATWQAAERAGADVVTLCDTNGGSLPEEIAEMTGHAKRHLSARLGIHTHDDIGLGVANALAGIAAGATHVQGTMNGYGERTGNCNMTSIMPIVSLKLGRQGISADRLKGLKELSHFVDETANIRPNPRLPWVGSAAFSHKGGTHVNAVQKVLRSYEHVDPSTVGNTRHVLISDLAGRSNIVMKARELGFDITNSSPALRDVLNRIKQLEHQGYEFEAADGSLALLLHKTLEGREAPFAVERYHVSMRSDRWQRFDWSGTESPAAALDRSICEAVVYIRVNGEGKVAPCVAEGDGPVNALDGAIRKALLPHFPSLGNVRLTDYKVRIVNPQTGTAARTLVLINSATGDASEWGTIGVDDNIVEASLQALVDSLEYALLKDRSRERS